MTENATSHSADQAAGARVLREAIRTPVFREILRLHLAESDPEAARHFVRTLLAEDVSLSLGLAATAGARINSLAAAIAELGRELSRYPAETLDAFLDGIVREVDADRLREVPAAWGPVLSRIAAEGAWAKALTGRKVAEAVNGAVASANRSIERNPRFLRELFAHLRFGPLFSLGWSLVKAAFAGLFRGKGR